MDAGPGGEKMRIGNRFTEKDLREWLSLHGFYGNSAKVQELELHAIGRPGWLQVFRFTVEAKSREGDWRTVYGCLREDERYSARDVKIFWNREERQRRLREWSHGLLQRQSSRSEEVAPLPLVGLYVTLFFGFVYGLIWLSSKLLAA